MKDLAARHIATIRNGQSDFEDRDEQSRVYYDGKVYYYDTQGMSMETFEIQVCVAFNVDKENVEVVDWGGPYHADIFPCYHRV
jgi:hypothetical protein